MSDLTNLLSSVVAVAKSDFTADVLPAVVSALPAMAVNPSGAVPTLLAAVAGSGAKLAADELTALESWAVGEIQKLVAKIPKA